MSSHKGFTLIELLVVIAIIAILSVVVILTLNPAKLLRQSRDSNRLSDLNTINTAVELAEANGLPLGNANTIYSSLPDPTLSTGETSTCSSLGLPPLPAEWSYQCAAPGSYRNVNGSGWIPIAFNTIPSGSPLGSLPVDPSNTSSSFLFYTYMTDGTHYELTAHNEAQKYQPTMWNDGGQYTDLYEQGTELSLLPVDIGGGNIYVMDSNSSSGRIQDFTSNGTYLSQFGNGQFYYPSGMALDKAGNIYEVDNGRTIEEFSPSGTYLSQFGGLYGSGNGEFMDATAIAVNESGDIYVVDYGNNRVEEFSPSGAYLSQFGSSGSGNGQFSNPGGIAIDGSGNVYVTDVYNNRIEEFSPNGTYLSQFGGSRGNGNGQLYYPQGVAVDGSGNVYVADSGNYRVEEFSPNGTYLSQFGSSGSGNGQFSNPGGIAIQ